jgi:arabinose-5-phosphate isomerase
MFVKVKDLMHSGADIPKVAVSASMKDVLREISTKRLGVTTVVDNDGALQGIITDGDLRRLMGNEADPMSKTAGEILSRNPRTIELEALGGAAVKLMEDNKITALVIVSGSDRVEGIVHLHDLLKAGVV